MSESITQPSESVPVESFFEALAAEAVDVIGVREEIARSADMIFAQIEDCDTFASGSAEEDEIFIATSLPIANAVIYYRTPKAQLQQARVWAHQRWPEEKDPTLALATLTLVYMINEGWKRYRDIVEKRPVWERIRNRVAALTEAPSAAVA